MNPNDLLVSDIMAALRSLEGDVSSRNTEINLRDSYLYGEGLWSRLEIEDGNDRTLYNYLTRVVDVHTAQLMGRGFNIYSYYNKEDLAPYEDKPDELKLAELRNKKLKANADLRKRAIDGIIRDVGGLGLFKNAARIGSAYGMTVFKTWFDKTDKRFNISVIESPQNYRAFWSDTDFRDRDADAYVYQISVDKANREYGSKLPQGESFEFSTQGDPLSSGTNNLTSDPLDQNAKSSMLTQTQRPMVTVIDFTGYIPGWASKNGKLTQVKRGEETKVSLLIVGGFVVQEITDEDLIPRYYIIQNRIEPRRAWGVSDLPRSALEINETIVQAMSDQLTLANKTLFPLIMAKGYTAGAIPKKKPRKMQVVPATPEQTIEVVNMNLASINEYKGIVDQLIDAFVRVTGIGRVMFDDPTINANSNQALMTTLKGLIDIVEDKQARWEPVIREMFEDALRVSAKYIPELKEAVEEPGWFLCVEWPSVLRREDAAYQQMWLNLFNAGVVSWETYLEKIGISDTGEEMDRVRDEMKDPIAAAVMGRGLSTIAAQLITPPQPQQPQTKYNVNVKADATLNPQDNEGVISEVMGAAQYQPPQLEAAASPTPENPTLTTDQNTGQSASQPGSGAPAVSPEGAIAQVAQQQGA